MTLRAPLALLTLAAVALLFIMLKSVQRHGQIVKEYIQGGDTETFRSDMTSETQSNGELLDDAIPPLNDDSVRIYIGVVFQPSSMYLMNRSRRGGNKALAPFLERHTIDILAIRIQATW